MPARPAIAPLITAILYLSVFFQASKIHTTAEEADAICVTNKVFAANIDVPTAVVSPDNKALPALKPNHPNHNSAAPTTAREIFSGLETSST